MKVFYNFIEDNASVCKINRLNGVGADVRLVPWALGSPEVLAEATGLLQEYTNQLSDNGVLGFKGELRYLIYATENFAGVLMLTPPESRGLRAYCECTFCLKRLYWGESAYYIANTLTQSLFRAVGKLKLTAKVYGNNPYPIRLLRKLGFEKEGRLRQETTVNGAEVDVLLYSKLKA